MILSRYTINNINGDAVQVPDASLFDLPEKVLQFGTSAMIRGLANYVIDEANRQGIFNGRVVAVKSTSDDASAFHKQDCLFTTCVRRKANIEEVEDFSINSSISRVLMAAGEWQHVLACAHNPELKIIVSDKEAVIQLVNDDIRLHPPKSFPGKLLAFLYERFKAFGGSSQSGVVVVPTEAILDNGKKLEAIVFELAHLNGLEDEFIEWLEACNQFCNSFLDGNVQAITGADAHKELEEGLGYQDQLLISIDESCLWYIEGTEQTKNLLGFAQTNKRIVVEPTSVKHQELKERWLKNPNALFAGITSERNQ